MRKIEFGNFRSSLAMNTFEPIAYPVELFTEKDMEAAVGLTALFQDPNLKN
jgi:hypothetical protein